MGMFGDWISFFYNFLRSFIRAVKLPALAVVISLFGLALITWWLSYSSQIVYPVLSPGLVLTYGFGGVAVLGLVLAFSNATPPQDY
ncbi:MAG: hypothetical protein HY319_12720 [Armatimonadetes bacterium]|nr:hypothetical protein [Armatimonadota bacterium]